MTIFRLKVQRFAQSCLFELSWGSGQQLSTTLPYPESLSGLYQEWQRIYLSFYKSALRGRVEASGSIAPPPIDWHARLVQAEARLLSEFHHWLRSAELYDLRATIVNSRLFPVREAVAPDSDLSVQPPIVYVFLTCSQPELEHLPWESWEMGTDLSMLGEIRLVRTPAQIRWKTETQAVRRQGKKARVLAILGDETGLNFQGDRVAVRSLDRLAEIEFVGWQPGLDSNQLKANICRALADERGWDILFFAGHSNETASTGGELAIAPNVSMSISEISSQLIAAKERGLKFALFNSCSGLSIANSLIDLGLSQVAVMREPIHNQVAQVFLVRFLQGLAEYKDVHESLISACQYLKFDKSLTYPSAYLVPSLFCHPGAVFFKMKPYGIRQVCKRLLPTRLEAIALVSLTWLSLSMPVQDFLLERRILVQAAYRNLTHQLVAQTPPPVLLVSIDEKSIRTANIVPPKPMKRWYLASLVDKLAASNAKVIGIDYLLDRPQDRNDKILAKSIQAAVARRPHPVWFAFASVKDDTEGWLKVLPEIATPNWSLQGHINLLHWYMRVVPNDDPSTAKMPLSYMLALAHRLNSETLAAPNQNPNRQQANNRSSLADVHEASEMPVPNLNSNTDLFLQVIRHLNREKNLNYKTIFSPSSQMQPLTEMSYDWGQIWLQPIIDFSIPPEQIYQTLPAWQLLEIPSNSPKLQHLQQQVVLIAPGGYSEAGVLLDGADNFPVPSAINYWSKERDQKPRRNFTGGEVHAYLIHHLLNQRLVVPIPDLWVLYLAVVIGKGTTIAFVRRQHSALILLAGMAGYGFMSMQLYISAAVLLPWFFPTAIWGVYAFPSLLKLDRKNVTRWLHLSSYSPLKDAK